ncbi:MAG: hypothetical protein K6L73_06155 [Cellvibrionaceae bacterium]
MKELKGTPNRFGKGKHLAFEDCFGNINRLYQKDIALICNVTERTARRWLKEGIPEQARKLLELHATGRIIPEDWNIQFKDDLLKTSLDNLNHSELQQAGWLINNAHANLRLLRDAIGRLDELEQLALKGKVTDIQEVRERLKRVLSESRQKNPKVLFQAAND